MNDTTPVESRCDGCSQTRPLFLYEPDHNMHVIPVPCEWCNREKQPLLCVRCWGAEREREENMPMSAAEADATAVFVQLANNNSRILARQEADKATCDGIAAATKQADADR
ncbi:hypothetical protein [Streptomyces lydicus]|uniref:hypothetical protein n=1 Tax=Streptomyces lydicus TaxID=47763 RepID=UPI001012BC57|nr:hypothetical protein [Streptomyces lydicus]MCZ1006372.1 hypothetical protein [Streptomyces lydicus]